MKLLIALLALSGITARTNVTSTGTSGTPVQLSPGAVYTAECSAKAYYRFGPSTVTVSKTRTDAEYGEPLYAGEKKAGIVAPKSLSQAYVVIISDSGTVTCTFWHDTDGVARSGGGGGGSGGPVTATTVMATDVTASGSVSASDLAASDDLTVGDDMAVTDDSTFTGDVDARTKILNGGVAASCVSFTGSVCLDDAGGVAVANGSGVVAAHISGGDGTITLPGTNNTIVGAGTLITVGNGFMVTGATSLGGTLTMSDLIRRNSAGLTLRGEPADGAAAVAINLLSLNTLSNTGARLLNVTNNAAIKFGIGAEGKLDMNCGDSSGSPGDATINAPCGRSAIPTGDTDIVVTSNQVSATDICQASMQSDDSTCRYIRACIPSAGSIKIITNLGCSAAATVGWKVFN